MGTRFEIILYGERELYLKTVAEEVFREIERLEAKLSYYNESSDIADLNQRAAHSAVLLDPPLFRLLEQAKQFSEQSEGAFDITVAPLLECWGFVGGSGALPPAESLAEALTKVGMHHLHLDASDRSAYFDVEGVRIELGAIGKGYALAQCVEMLHDFEIESALLHGGTSSVYALGTPPDAEGWKVAVQSPRQEAILAHITLKDISLSVSAPRNKGFQIGEKRYGHVLDPRSGTPISAHLLAALTCPSPLAGDAFSTALLVQGKAWFPTLSTLLTKAHALFVEETETGKEEITCMTCKDCGTLGFNILEPNATTRQS
jgi:thiamine biosynthesis lipoprotein